MKTLLCAICLVAVAGCSYSGRTLQSYFEDPRSFIKDPHFAQYQEKRDTLERKYLNDEISYAEYSLSMDELDETYAGEVQERNSKLMDEMPH